LYTGNGHQSLVANIGKIELQVTVNTGNSSENTSKSPEVRNSEESSSSGEAQQRRFKFGTFLSSMVNRNRVRRFPEALEEAFQADYCRRNRIPQRYGLLGLLLIMLILGSVDINSPPASYRIGLLGVYGFICPLLLGQYRFTYHPAYKRWSQQAMVVTTWATSGILWLLEYLVPTDKGSDASPTTVALILQVMVASALLRLRTVYLAVCCSVIAVLHAVLSFTVLHLPYPLWNASSLFTVCIIAVLAARIAENYARNEFRLRRALMEKRAKLAEQNRRLGELAESRLQAARDVEHEIKNKLGSIGTPIEVALRAMNCGMEPAFYRPFLDDAQLGVENLHQLLQTMLNIARMAAGHKPSLEEAEWVCLNEIVSQACDRKRAQLTLQRDIDADLERETRLPTIRAELNLPQLPKVRLHCYSFRLVLENLLENAVKYSLTGGTITVRTFEADGDLIVCVADQGIGIAPERLEGLFDTVYDRGRAEDYKITGNGIGLHLIKKLIDAQGARIWAESKGEGHGATFFLALPRRL
jgi:signal transduction histidine kinase